MNTRTAVTLLALLALAAPVSAESWGTIKGQVVFDGAVPERAKLNVDKDQAACMPDGKPLLSEKLVVDEKTKGVKWVMVWLVDPNDPKAAIPIHPDLKALKQKEVFLDQPCCMFEPHVLGMREGQVLVAKNSASIPHNVKIDSIDPNPSLNQLIPPKGQLKVDGWKALPTLSPSLVGCSIHMWMNAYIRVFPHPYYAVTDEKGNFEIKNAPAGNYNLVIWQEDKGWVVQQEGKSGRLGIPITIKADATTDLGQYKLKLDAK
jgi:hypothetical protein